MSRAYTANGLNQYTASGSVSPTYDARGNLTSAGATAYAYSSENMLVSASGGIALAYDPLLRLQQTSGGSAGTTRFAYDGQDLIAEYNGSGALLRRYVHGPGSDEPLVWYEGAGTADRRWLHADERGSVIAVSNGAGTTIATNAYDEYGIPKSSNIGRFQYTGQTWLAELGMYHYKARIYSPTLGRFLQTDPIGYGDGMNVYAYVGGDPVNGVDPSGLNCVSWRDPGSVTIEDGAPVVTAGRLREACWGSGSNGGGPTQYFDGSGGGGGGGPGEIPCEPVPGDVYTDPKTATLAGARAADVANTKDGKGSTKEFHANIRATTGGFSFRLDSGTDGRVTMRLNADSYGSAHNHPWTSDPSRTGYLSSSSSNAQGHIILINDHRSYMSFFEKASVHNPSIRNQFHVALAADGRLYHWPPGSSLKQRGTDSGPSQC